MAKSEPALAPVDTLPATPNTFDLTVGEIMLNAPLLQQIDAMAGRMASARNTIPKHLQNNEGDCWAVIMQAIQWKMNPFVVAQKTHLVNGTLGYEAQLVNAVIQASGMIEGGFHYEHAGEGAELRSRVGARLAGDKDITWGEWLASKDVAVKNSPLWKTNPRQQMGYLQLKNWARLYCPGAILGVYTSEELRDYPVQEREVNPSAPAGDGSRVSAMKDKLGVVEEAELVEEAPPAEEVHQDDDAPAEITYADVAETLNAADSPDALRHAVQMMSDFIGTGDNDKFKEELGDLYRQRLDQLKAAADNG